MNPELAPDAFHVPLPDLSLQTSKSEGKTLTASKTTAQKHWLLPPRKLT